MMMNMLSDKKGYIALILLVLSLGSCKERVDTEIHMPERTEKMIITEETVIENAEIKTGAANKYDMPEPEIIYDQNSERVMDGFSTITSKDISFIIIKIGDDKYGLYTVNGVELSSFRIVGRGTELLDIYDFIEVPIICCVGDVDFVTGGIRGYDRMPAINKITNRVSTDIEHIIENCVWIKDFDRNAKNKKGIWKAHGSDGRTYIITYVNDKDMNDSYYVVISDKTVSLYLKWDDLLVKFR